MSNENNPMWRIRPWSALSVLRAWERGDGAGRTARGLAVLSAVLPERSRQELLDLPLGRRDQLLLQARIDLLGTTLQGSVSCPSCQASQAFALEVDADLLSQGVAIDDPSRSRLELPDGGPTVEIRAANGHDALAIEGWRPTAAWQELMRRSLRQARAEGVSEESEESSFDPAHLSPEALSLLGDELERLDPLALVPLAVACGGCGLEWQPLLEIVEIVWAEVENMARRLLDEAQTLALAYGWSEEEIFAMSGRRRRYYLQNAPSGATDEEDAPRPFPTQAPWNPAS